MMRTTRRWAMAAALGMMVGAGGRVEAAPILYLGDKAGFLAAAPGLGLESFESGFTPGSSVAFPGFTVTAVGASSLPTQFTDSPFFPPTDGSSVLGYAGGDASGTTLTLAFGSAIAAFGLDFLGFGNFAAGSLSVSTDTGSVAQVLRVVPPLTGTPPPPIFFGVIDADGFSSVTFTITTPMDAVGIDAVRFGGSVVPEPSGLALSGVALAGLGVWARRRPAA